MNIRLHYESYIIKIPEDLKEDFFKLRDREDVATLLEITSKQLNFHLYILRPSTKYTKFYIPKKSGKYREISAPISPIKIIQRKLKQVLEAVYQPKPATQGFRSNHSIVTNARIHKRRRYVLNLDLDNFFSTIHFGRVRGMFMGNPYRLNNEVSTILAQICCHDGHLPQGAPTSPIISNMICARLDAKLQQLAKRHQCTYSRYADDITFSTNRSSFPFALAHLSHIGQVEIGKELMDVIIENGFQVNSPKTRLQSRSLRQEVTGLTVNRYPNVQRRYIKRLRGILYAWKKYGVESTASRYFSNYAGNNHKKPNSHQPSFEKIVLGKIEFIGMVKGKKSHVYLDLLSKLNALSPGLIKESKLSTIHLSFTKPFIYTEGKTDRNTFKQHLRD